MADKGCEVLPVPPAGRWILQGGAGALAAAASVWPAGLPRQACRATSSGDHHCLWLGPDEFLLLGMAGAQLPELRAALTHEPHSLVDVSHRQIGLEVRGVNCEALLAGGCPLDLDPSQFPVGMCTRTLFGKADIILWRRLADAFQIEVWRSFADYTASLLAEIARG